MRTEARDARETDDHKREKLFKLQLIKQQQASLQSRLIAKKHPIAIRPKPKETDEVVLVDEHTDDQTTNHPSVVRLPTPAATSSRKSTAQKGPPPGLGFKRFAAYTSSSAEASQSLQTLPSPILVRRQPVTKGPARSLSISSRNDNTTDSEPVDPHELPTRSTSMITADDANVTSTPSKRKPTTLKRSAAVAAFTSHGSFSSLPTTSRAGTKKPKSAPSWMPSSDEEKYQNPTPAQNRRCANYTDYEIGALFVAPVPFRYSGKEGKKERKMDGRKEGKNESKRYMVLRE